MMNVFAKTLVLVHVVLSLAGMTWALMLFLQGRDLGWKEPGMEVQEYNTDGTPSTKPGAVVRFASEYDKSVVAVQEAGATRDRAYRHVKPALESVVGTEKYLWENHLFYRKELARLHNERSDDKKKDEFKVFRLKDAGHALPIGDGELGRPEFELDDVGMIKKPFKEYQADLESIAKEIAVYQGKIREVSDKTGKITVDLTGTNEKGEYLQPGLYALEKLEFKYQEQLKVEIDDIKPNWSKALERAGGLRLRRVGLEENLRKLQQPPPAPPKIDKKL
jgi:hypothetical protein